MREKPFFSMGYHMSDMHGSGTRESIEELIASNKNAIVAKGGVPIGLDTTYQHLKGFRQRQALRGKIWLNSKSLANELLLLQFGAQDLDTFSPFIDSKNIKGSSHREATQLLSAFLPRIFRRPLEPQDLEARLERVKSARNPFAVLKHEMKAALMSPGFLYRGFLMRRQPGIHPVSP